MKKILNTILLGLFQEEWTLISMIKELEIEALSSNSGPDVFLFISSWTDYLTCLNLLIYSVGKIP